MREEYSHLKIQRLEPMNPRRRRPPPFVRPPSDIPGHATKLTADIDQLVDRFKQQIPGFDPRLLLTLEVEGLQPEDLETIQGLQVVSQEDRTIVVLFASYEGLEEFKTRLSRLVRGERVTRQDILFAIKGVDEWTTDHRMGPALRVEGVPEESSFAVDVELWPLEKGPERQKLLRYFEEWCKQRNAAIIDSVNQETVILYRVRADRNVLDEMLRHRDVRLVDLPPRYQLNVDLIHLPLAEIALVPEPPRNASGVVVLDSGLATGHPLLARAIGDAQAFYPGAPAEDECGHGTMVGGLVLYGDIWDCAGKRQFIPQLRLFSGRVTDAKGDYEQGFVENHVIDAVRYFVKYYNCRIFNVSLGDERKPYVTGHVRGLAAVLDTLAREYRVLFVVSTGNFRGQMGLPGDWRREYPDYLLRNSARIIDPAPALNVITVGSIARHEVPRMGARFPNDPAYQPIARQNQPSPFSRTGPGPLGAIKPEVVEYGGNCYVDLRGGVDRVRGFSELGELSTSRHFTQNLFASDSGTSYSAAKIAHLAGLVANDYPDATPNLLRALIVAHSRHTRATKELVHDEEKLYRLVGYGKPDWDAVLRSSENKVTLLAQDEIEEDQYHFFHVPIPHDFYSSGRRIRRITVALAHTPLVRRTRYEYKGSSMRFRVVCKGSFDEVRRVFRRGEELDQLPPETGDFRPSMTIRSKGTVQAATWEIKRVDARTWADKQLFIVVARAVPNWAKGLVKREPYALVVVLEDEGQVRYYTQIQQILRVGIRV